LVSKGLSESETSEAANVAVDTRIKNTPKMRFLMVVK
jgi:hypothetical protein